MVNEYIEEEPDAYILTHDHFRGSDIPLEFFYTQRETKENAFFHREVDSATTSVELFNISSKMMNIALRDGSVLTLRPTSPSILNGVHCYRANAPRDNRGRVKSPKPDERMDAMPVIKEGLYVVRRKSLSFNTNGVKGSTLGAKTTREGRPIYGDGFDDYLQRFPNIHVRKTTKGAVYPDGSNTPTMVDKRVVNGPVEYFGEEHILKNGNEWSRYAGRDAHTFVLDYRIDLAAIEDAPNGEYYFSPADLLISVSKSPQEMVHPESEEGRRIERKQIMRELIEEHSTTIMITSVNNDLSVPVSPYYCNLGGMVVSCHPMQNPLYMGKDYKDGIYIYTKEGNGSVKETYIPYNEALAHEREDAPKFFLSAAEARKYGDTAYQLKQRDKEHEIKFKERINELEIIHKKEIAEIEKSRQSNKLESEKEKAKLDHQYQASSTAKREASDSFKLWVGVGGVVLGIVAAYLGSRK